MYITDKLVRCLRSIHGRPCTVDQRSPVHAAVLQQADIIPGKIPVKRILNPLGLNKRTCHVHIFRCHFNRLNRRCRKLIVKSFSRLLICGYTDHNHKYNRNKKTQDNLISYTEDQMSLRFVTHN